MSFICTTYCPEGIAMSADSRMTLNSQRQINANQTELISVTSSNASQKITILKNKFGISFCGDAAINNQPIMGFVVKFEQEVLTNETEIVEIPQLLLDYFRQLNPLTNVIFHLTGYMVENNLKTPHVYNIETNRNIFNRINMNPNGIILYAASWAGEGEAMGKLFAQQSIISQQGDQTATSPPLSILVNFFNLQDAIDFCIFATKLTIDTSVFLPKPRTVGHPIDVLILDQREGIKWIQRKEYHGE